MTSQVSCAKRHERAVESSSSSVRPESNAPTKRIRIRPGLIFRIAKHKQGDEQVDGCGEI